MGPQLRDLARAGGNDPTPPLAVREIFSEELAGSPRFRQHLGGALTRIFHDFLFGASISNRLSASSRP
jgi:hypothetical protein